MGISWLSKPLAPLVEPYKPPIEAILKAADVGTNRYTQLVGALVQDEQSALSIDTALGSEEATKLKDQKIKEMKANLDKLVRADLSNPENISKLHSIFDPITTNEDILSAAAATKSSRKALEIHDYWCTKKPELCNEMGQRSNIKDIKSNMSLTLEQARKQGYKSIIPTPYYDWTADIIEKASKLKPEEITFTEERNGRVYTTKKTILSAERLLEIFPMNAKALAQMRVEANLTMDKTTPEEIFSYRLGNIYSTLSAVDKLNMQQTETKTNLTNIITGITNNDPEYTKVVNEFPDRESALAYFKEQLAMTEDALTKNEETRSSQLRQISDIKNIYGVTTDQNDPTKVLSVKRLTDDQLLDLKTSYLSETTRYEVLSNIAYTSISQESKPDEFKLELFKAQLDLLTGTSKGSKGNKGDGSGEDVPPETEDIFNQGPGIEEESKKEYTIQEYEKLVDDLRSSVGKDLFDPNGGLYKTYSDAFSFISEENFGAAVKEYSDQMEIIAKAEDEGTTPILTDKFQSVEELKRYGKDSGIEDYLAKHAEAASLLSAQVEQINKISQGISAKAEAQSGAKFDGTTDKFLVIGEGLGGELGQLADKLVTGVKNVAGLVGGVVQVATGKKSFSDAINDVTSFYEGKDNVPETSINILKRTFKIPGSVVKSVADGALTSEKHPDHEKVVKEIIYANPDKFQEDGEYSDAKIEAFVNSVKDLDYKDDLHFVTWESQGDIISRPLFRVIPTPFGISQDMFDDDSLNKYMKLRRDFTTDIMKGFTIKSFSPNLVFTSHNNKTDPAYSAYNEALNLTRSSVLQTGSKIMTGEDGNPKISLSSLVLKEDGIYSQAMWNTKKDNPTSSIVKIADYNSEFAKKYQIEYIPLSGMDAFFRQINNLRLKGNGYEKMLLEPGKPYISYNMNYNHRSWQIRYNPTNESFFLLKKDPTSGTYKAIDGMTFSGLQSLETIRSYIINNGQIFQTVPTINDKLKQMQALLDNMRSK